MNLVQFFKKVFRKNNDFLGIKGEVTMKLIGPDGSIKETRTLNLVVTTGIGHIVDQMSDQAEAQLGWLAVGTGTTAAAAGDTALETELARVALDSLTDSDPSVVYVATLSPGTGTGAITEAGLFNASSSGVMATRTVFSVINKGALDTLEFTWTLTFAAA